jgi:hypothetical protein
MIRYCVFNRGRTLRKSSIALAATLIWLPFGAPCAWPQPADGGGTENVRAPVAFTAAWAERLRSLHSFSELQDAIGATAQLDADQRADGIHRNVYRWIGVGGRSRLVVFVYPDGAFAGTIASEPSYDLVTFNSFGAYVCAACDPPVKACGRRPSWIPRDLHWDNFDCENTLTGPQGATPPQP